MKINIKKYFQALGATLGVVFLAFLVVMGIDFTGGASLAETEYSYEPNVAVPSGGTINVLLLCTDEDGLRTDAMMLGAYNTKNNTVNLLSIPRDLRMYVGNRYQKINAAHAFETDGEIGGPTAACEVVTRLTGVPVNYYIDFSFDGVAHVINELGPIEFTIPDLYGDGVGMVYDDPVQSLHINLPPGTYDLDGSQVVQLLRYRKGNKDPDTGIRNTYPNGDEDRVKVQQEFLRALVDQKLNVSLIKKLPAIFTDVKEEIKTNLTVKDVLRYSRYLADFTSAGIRTETIPGDDTQESGNGAVFVPNMHKLQQLVRDMFGVDGENMKYCNPDEDPELYADGYMTLGGYVRTEDRDTLSDLRTTQLTNDELCLLRDIEQSIDSTDVQSLYEDEEVGDYE